MFDTIMARGVTPERLEQGQTRAIVHENVEGSMQSGNTMESMPQFAERLDPIELFPNLRLGIYELSFSPSRPLKHLDYFGSAWRGVMGKALQARSCPWGESAACRDCSVTASCAYCLCYEKNSTVSGFANPPRPYIISPLDGGADCGQIMIRLTLIGEAADHAPTILSALRDAAANGIGGGKVPCRQQEAVQVLPDGRKVRLDSQEAARLRSSFPLAGYLDARQVPPPPWRVSIVHPLRIRKDGRELRRLDWPTAWKSFAIRVSMLHCLYHDAERLPQEDWPPVAELLAAPGCSQDRTRPFPWKRYSSTQKRLVAMDGVCGESVITPPAGLELFWWHWWRTAELLHIGKGADMGMGRILLEAMDSAPESAQ
jgi:hypothetical protein